jgi:hypothetical protein
MENVAVDFPGSLRRNAGSGDDPDWSARSARQRQTAGPVVSERLDM